MYINWYVNDLLPSLFCLFLTACTAGRTWEHRCECATCQSVDATCDDAEAHCHYDCYCPHGQRFDGESCIMQGDCDCVFEGHTYEVRLWDMGT